MRRRSVGGLFTLLLSSLLACGELAAPHAPVDPEGLERDENESSAPPMNELELEPPLVIPPVLAPARGRVYFIAPGWHSVLSGPLVNGKVSVHITMGLEGAAVVPAGPLVEGTGHHHLLVDTEEVPFGSAIPFDETHMHYGKAQVEADVALVPGAHTLSLQLADGLHRSYGPSFAASIDILVVQEAGDAVLPATDAGRAADVIDAGQALAVGLVRGLDSGL